jgi:hypothetical protein
MGVTTVRSDNRRVAGLALGGLTACYWVAVARPLVAVLVGSLVVAGERANRPGGMQGRLPLRSVPAVAAVELGVALQAGLAGHPWMGLLAGSLFLLAVYLSGPSLSRGAPADGGRSEGPPAPGHPGMRVGGSGANRR